MDNVQRQRENIVLYKDKKDGADYIRIEYAGNGDISQLLVRDADVEMADNGSAYIPAAIFRLSDFYDRYSPHAYIEQPIDHKNLSCLFQRLYGIP